MNSKNSDWNELEKLVARAISERKPHLIFKTIKVEDYKYIQKIAENHISVLEVRSNIIILIIATGLSASWLGRNLKNEDIIIYSLGMTILFISLYLVLKWRPDYKISAEIILKAERKIQSLECNSKIEYKVHKEK